MSTTPSTYPDRVAVETPRGRIRAGPVVDTRPITESGQLHWEYLVDLGAVRLWVPASTATP